jgi:TonB family protein
MEAFALYLLKSVIWLTGFAIIYFLFLKNERFFRLKRYYLVAGILIAFIFPLLTYHYQIEITAPADNITAFTPSGTVIATSANTVSTGKPLNYRHILLLAYLSGILFFTLRGAKHISLLIRTINKTEFNDLNRARLIRSSGFSGSFSFFNYVFINPSVDERELDVIVKHELVHVTQKHWLDLILVELLRTVQWVNPFAWIYTGFIRQNHEYIADEVMLQQAEDPAVYKAVLVNQLFDSRIFSLSNSFNYSLNKKRFDMMKKMVASPYRRLKIFLVLPVFAIIFYAFSAPEYNYITPSEEQTDAVMTSETIEKEARGIVVNEEGTPLQGVRIIVSKSLTGTLTDAGGRFALGRIPDGSTLIFSFRGYKTYTLPPLMASNTALRVRLVKDPDYKEGVTIRTTDGSEANVLIVVDGSISIDGFGKIDPNSILSMNILKEKSATDKYGELGKFGVIEITTKGTSASDSAVQDPQAGQKEVKGIVLNLEGKPLAGVDVTTTGTMGKATWITTGSDGRFSFDNVQDDATVFFALRGYKRVTLKADFTREMSVKMEVDPELKVPAQRPEPLVVIDGVITDKNYLEAPKELGYDIAIIKNLFGKEATDKYGERGANGVMELTTRKKAQELGLKPEYFPRRTPDDYPTFQGQKWTSFREWVIDHVKYPAEAQSKEIEGWVNVNFTVEVDGTISNPKPLGSSDPVLNGEVIRTIMASPQWDRPKNPAVDIPFTSSVNVGFKLPGQIVEEEPFVVVEEMPMYPGGEGELLKFITENTQYPEAAKAQKIGGKVIVRFYVNTNGETEGLSVLRSVHPLLDAEALRVVDLLTGFKPGKQGGKAVPVWYMVPVNFNLPETNQP